MFTTPIRRSWRRISKRYGKEIIPEHTYTDLDNQDITIRQTCLWSILYSTGYLTDAVKPDGRIHKLVIPNKEVRKIYEDRISFEAEKHEDEPQIPVSRKKVNTPRSLLR